MEEPPSPRDSGRLGESEGITAWLCFAWVIRWKGYFRSGIGGSSWFQTRPSMVANVGESTSGRGSFECSICFELLQEPIVTLCGHLFCWPCLCKWLRIHSHSPKCPVCKAVVEEDKARPALRQRQGPD
ncbi:hypothetical protein ACQ4PT_054559 [Festuca glaucescens]